MGSAVQFVHDHYALKFILLDINSLTHIFFPVLLFFILTF